ncbi:amidohydrolase family protein [Actinosynnema sp. NPDC059335]|uniref:amidohydrolase family protein n=1 Tax=Actinosynnema sp. NPDC059335 TaxID=3346804 RepID=UPI003670FBF7
MTQHQAVVYRGATVITGAEGGPVIPSADLVVDEGRIVAVGPAGTADSGGEVVDLGGRFVMPAIINPHVHIGYMRDGFEDAAHYSRENILDHLRRFAYHGVGVVQSLGTDRDDTELALREEQRSGELRETGLATLYTAGTGLVAPTPGSTNGGAHFAADVLREVTDPEAARREVRALAAKRVDVVKFWLDSRNGTKAKMEPPVYRAIIDQAHREGLRVIAHIHDLDDAKGVIRTGVDGTAHLVREPGPDRELIDLLLERDVFMFTSLGIQRGITLGAALLDDPFLAETVTETERDVLREQLKAAPEQVVRYMTGVYRTLRDEVKELVAAGVRLVLSADTGLSSQFPGFAEHFELASMVDAGMTPAQAIDAGTAQAARVLGIERLQGTLAAGKKADFVVLAANPLDDIVHTRRIVDVHLAGERVDRQGLRARWTA